MPQEIRPLGHPEKIWWDDQVKINIEREIGTSTNWKVMTVNKGR